MENNNIKLVTPYSTDLEYCLQAAKTAYDIAEYELEEQGKGSYQLLKDLGTVIEHLEKALDPLRGLEADGII